MNDIGGGAGRNDHNRSYNAYLGGPKATMEKRKLRIGPLTTVGQVAGELGRLYRQARRGDLAVADASRLATILAVMRQCLEASELERRIGEMEAAIAPVNATSTVVQLRSRR